jgi:hypothetical protein
MVIITLMNEIKMIAREFIEVSELELLIDLPRFYYVGLSLYRT